MKSGHTRSIAFLIALIITPFVLIPFSSPDKNAVMITESEPNYTPFIRIVLIVLFAMIAFANRRLIFSNNKLGYFLGFMSLGAAGQIVFRCGGYYDTVYEHRVFDALGTTSKPGSVNILRVWKVNGRGGPFYFGAVNPKNIAGFQSQVKLSSDFYSLWSRYRKTSVGSGALDISSPCLVRVKFEKVGHAERIVGSENFIRQSDVISCG